MGGWLIHWIDFIIYKGKYGGSSQLLDYIRTLPRLTSPCNLVFSHESPHYHFWPKQLLNSTKIINVSIALNHINLIFIYCLYFMAYMMFFWIESKCGRTLHFVMLTEFSKNLVMVAFQGKRGEKVIAWAWVQWHSMLCYSTVHMHFLTYFLHAALQLL